MATSKAKTPKSFRCTFHCFSLFGNEIPKSGSKGKAMFQHGGWLFRPDDKSQHPPGDKDFLGYEVNFNQLRKI